MQAVTFTDVLHLGVLKPSVHIHTSWHPATLKACWY